MQRIANVVETALAGCRATRGNGEIREMHSKSWKTAAFGNWHIFATTELFFPGACNLMSNVAALDELMEAWIYFECKGNRTQATNKAAWTLFTYLDIMARAWVTCLQTTGSRTASTITNIMPPYSQYNHSLAPGIT